LVNNAGIGQVSVRNDRTPIRFWETTPEQWGRFVAINAAAPINMARAVLPHMLAAKRGRIVTVTTSLGTMVREGFLLYGSSKAAAEAAMAVLAADLAGTGVTSNVLVPGGMTDTPMVGDVPNREKMLRPGIMVEPLLWLLSDEARDVNGRRFIAADWDTALSPSQAADRAGAPIAWLSIARMPIEP
jgi:NAD(P)-dependent dehydrogenase (short-subunit alcohol dehydrogenase family)